MSYGAANSLQKAIYGALLAHGEVYAMVGDAIFDQAPAGPLPPLYLSLGTEQVLARGDCSAALSRHSVTVTVVSEDAGFTRAKLLAEAVSDALDGAKPTLSRGRILSLRFARARATRFGNNRKRRIDLRFEALVDVPRILT